MRRLAQYSDLSMKASGPAVIFRSSIWRDLQVFEDIDHCVGFMCLSANKKLEYNSSFFVFDLANNLPSKDLLARSRMKRKSLLSYISQLRAFSSGSFSKYNIFAIIGYSLHNPLRFFVFRFFLFAFLLLQYQFAVSGIFSSSFLPDFRYLNYLQFMSFSFLLGIFGFIKIIRVYI